jgi:hypothetical protein
MYVLQEITFTKCDEDGNEICDRQRELDLLYSQR